MPGLPAVGRCDDHALIADDPAVRDSAEIQMKQLGLRRRRLSPPGHAFVVRSHQKRIDHLALPIEQRPDDVAVLLIRKSYTEELRGPVLKISRLGNNCLAPRAPAVVRKKHLSPGDEISILFVSKI